MSTRNSIHFRNYAMKLVGFQTPRFTDKMH